MSETINALGFLGSVYLSLGCAWIGLCCGVGAMTIDAPEEGRWRIFTLAILAWPLVLWAIVTGRTTGRAE